MWHNANSLIRFLRRLIGVFIVEICTVLLRLLPFRIRLRIRDRLSAVRVMDYGRLPIYMQVDSSIESEVRLREVEKEPETVRWIEEWFEPGDIFYDIGANVGSYSLIAFRHLERKIRVYAFEPGFPNFPQLCRNIFLNEAGDAITPFPVALFDRTLTISFHYQNLLTGGALHALGDAVNYCNEMFQPVFTLPTLAYRLDEFVETFSLLSPNHIKIDVDGNELQILQGAGFVLPESVKQVTV